MIILEWRAIVLPHLTDRFSIENRNPHRVETKSHVRSSIITNVFTHTIPDILCPKYIYWCDFFNSSSPFITSSFTLWKALSSNSPSIWVIFRLSSTSYFLLRPTSQVSSFTRTPWVHGFKYDELFLLYTHTYMHRLQCWRPQPWVRKSSSKEKMW